jgi:DNA-binding GntR family transcriptional regulator
VSAPDRSSADGGAIVGIRDPRRGESRYRLLTQLLRERIFQGEFEERRLPTEVSLAQEFGLSRQTVRQAFQELVSEGIVYRVRGSGTFVTPRETRYNRPFSSVDDLLQLQLDTTFELIEALHRTVRPSLAAQLRQEFPDLWALTFRRRHLGKAFCVTRVYLPLRIGWTLADVPELSNPAMTTATTVIGMITSRGFHISEAEQVITASAADEYVAELLSTPPGTPLLHITRTYIDASGQVLEVAVSEFLPSEYQHRTRLARRSEPAPMPVDPGSRPRGDTAPEPDKTRA